MSLAYWIKQFPTQVSQVLREWGGESCWHSLFCIPSSASSDKIDPFCVATVVFFIAWVAGLSGCFMNGSFHCPRIVVEPSLLCGEQDYPVLETASIKVDMKTSTIKPLHFQRLIGNISWLSHQDEAFIWG